MFDFVFKLWLQLHEGSECPIVQEASEIDVSGMGDRFQGFMTSYLIPFANAILAHGAQNKKFLSAVDKEQINHFLSSAKSPADIANRAGGSSVAMYSPFVSADFATALAGYERIYKTRKTSGWIENTWNTRVKSGEDYLFKNYKTFSDYLAYVNSLSRSSYEINSFYTLLYHLIMRIKVILQSYNRTVTTQKKRNVDVGGEQWNIKQQHSASGSNPDMPVKIQDCFVKFFAKKATELEKVVRDNLANMNSPSFYNEPKTRSGYNAARIHLWFYLTCKYLSEKPDEVYEEIKKLYLKFIDMAAADREKVNPQLIRNFLHSFHEQRNAPIRKFIETILKSGDDFSKLGLASIAISVYKNFVTCSDHPEPDTEIINSMPSLAGTKSYMESIKDNISCRSKREKSPLHEDRPTAASGEQEKVDFFVNLFFSLNYPNWQFAAIQREALSNELWKELNNCLKASTEDEEE